jgi:hypothetical protein
MTRSPSEDDDIPSEDDETRSEDDDIVANG